MTPERDIAHVPPRLAERLLQRAAAWGGWGDVTTGDLREEFASLAKARGERAARRWYYRETAAIAAAAAPALVRRAFASLSTFFRPRGDHMLRTLFHDARLALRTTRREPLVSGVVLITLALGLGSNAATFGMIDSLLLHPFPVADVDRLVMISENATFDSYPRESVSAGNYLDFRAKNSTLDGLSAMSWWDVNLSGADRPERVQGFRVTGDFFRILGVVPARGRLLEPSDTVFGGHRQVVIGDSLWRRLFASTDAALGSTIRLDGEPHTIVGIAPAGFDFPDGAEIWGALAFSPEEAANRGRHFLTAIGRLRHGVSLEQARADLSTTYERLKQSHPDETRGRHLVLRTFTAGMVDQGMPQVLILWQVAATLVLLIGCTNIVNLLLARGASRQRELAVRLALGAGRGRIVRQLLVESLLLALLSTPLALGVAALAFRLVRAMMPAELVRFVPGWTEMGVGATVILFTLAAAAVASIVFGLLPAVQTSKPVVASSLRDGGRSVTTSTRGYLRRGLVVAEIALALPLLIASGLAAIGAYRFANGPQGYDPDGLLRARIILPQATYPDDPSRREFARRLVEAARRQPGVEMAATTSALPSSATNPQRDLTIEGRASDPEHPLLIGYRSVSPDYLAVMRIPVLQGRTLSEADSAASEPVSIVSLSAARRFWGDESPIGRRIRVGGADRPWTTVVGIAGDTIHDWADQRRTPTVYLPAAQAPSLVANLVLRTSADPASLGGAVRAALAEVDPMQPAFDVMTQREGLHIRTAGLRFIGTLMAAFGVLALLLAAVGIYSVMAFYVAQRRHEMGIRMALGATRGDVMRLTLSHSARMAGLGILLGLLLGIGLGRVLENALFGVVAAEPWLFAAIAATLALVALVATIIPARHAVRGDLALEVRE